MNGPWVVPKNNYEKKFCKVIGWEIDEGRYCDAFDGHSYIEIKKGQSCMWFDLVRYAEIVLGVGTQNTITVFIRYNKKRESVEECLIIDTKNIIKFMKMNKTDSRYCIRMKKELPRSLNMLASATVTDMRKMASYIVIP